MESKPKVLIVEDDAVLRDAYCTVLQAEGYEVWTAADGLDALTQARKIEMDVILLDMLMPNLNGVEFLREYKAPEEHPQTRIIVFSNMSVPSDVSYALKLGATKYLTKSSFTPKEMEGIVREVLAGE